MKYYHVVLPTKLQYGLNKKTGKVKEYALNLNKYRNTHFMMLNKMKQLFTETLLASNKLQEIPKLSKVFLVYIYYPARLSDTNNVCSVVDKFFQDALVKAEIIPDDNFNIIKGSVFLAGKSDKTNPRVEVFICEVD